MYPIESKALELYKKNYRQVATITMETSNGTVTITEADIKDGGLLVNRYSCSGERIELGSAIAGELTLKLNNIDGKFNSVQFEGAELYVTIGIKKWDARNWEMPVLYTMPLGYFTVDRTPRLLETIEITALDRMVQFDKYVDRTALTLPTTIGSLISHCATTCNVPSNVVTSELPNYDYVISTLPDSPDLTYRQLISWCAGITGNCAYINREGQLCFGWYEEKDFTLTPADRYNSDLLENAITITGIVYDLEAETYVVGDSGYALDLTDNELLTHDYNSVLGNLSDLIGLSYIPFSALTVPLPQLDTFDTITFVNKDSNVTVIITDMTFTLNGSTAIEGKGETEIQNGWASANPLTNRERVIIEKITRAQNDEINARVQSVLEFNELIANSLGLFVTDVPQEDGSKIRYLHDTEQLENSTNIFTFTANGIAWTNQGWNDGSPVWQYGVTSAGDALFRFLSAQGIDVSSPSNEYNIKLTPDTFQVLYRSMIVTQIYRDLMTIPRANFTEYSQYGRVRLVPYSHYDSELGEDVELGANLIFVD